MDKDEQDRKTFLKEQVKWCKKQDAILEEIEMRLYKMKEIAQYVVEHELTSVEIDGLNEKLYELKREVQFLEKQLYSVVH